MPRIDGTGPMGNGTMTGRGLGTCGNGIRIGNCGRRKGFGFWGSFRSPKNQIQSLEEEEKMILEELEIIKAEKEALKNQK